MSDISANLSLPFILPSQAQKHVTFNEGMRRLDTLVQLMVLAVDQTAPPATPNDGDRYIVPAGATGDWAGHEGDIAVFEETSWQFLTPGKGWVGWVDTANELHVFDGTDWLPISDTFDLQNLDMVGISTTADTINRLAVASEASLFTHAGAGHQMKLNKSTAADTASLLFQTGWSGRAEMGTTGTDDFEIKVSGDGAVFHSAMIATAATGRVQFPSGVDGLSPAEFGNGSLLTTDYSASKGVDLVANSTGLLGNSYNYPAEFTYDPVVTPNLPASFYFPGYFTNTAKMQEFLPVDPNKVYRLQSYIRQESQPGDWSAFTYGERHTQYMGLYAYDADWQVISAQHHMRYKHSSIDSLTTLAAPLAPGDTSISLTNASGWNETDTTANKRGVIIFGYKNSAGYTYDYYSRLVEPDLFDLGQVNKTTHIVTLNKPLPAHMGNPDDPGGIWPAGTRIANSSSGNSFKYAFYAGLHVPEVDRWYLTTGHIGGIDTSGTNYTSNFAPGTTYVIPFWLPNFSNRAGGYAGHPDTGTGHKVWFTGASVTPEPLAVMSEVLTGADTGRKDIKVPTGDFAAGTISLAATSISIDPV
ncbi:DUF2793 domain-containing protein [Profundibacter amoris]|uniref:DUF2793 domain-containing protein n=1 Tax=Profundibacter amoris TaxID=2171755 RepID=A0A347UK23_9RHOB|nr:DUF2793 domain-containing protein [Profundibacter amoris]AXX99201.1 DUF2793 domain-containing protein [Profundibacter amoris]